MKHENTISRWQQLCLGILCMLSPIIRILPREVTERAGSYAWLSVLLSTVPLFILFLIVSRFLKKAQDNEGFGELIIKSLGSFVGKAVIAAFTLWLIFYLAFTVRSAADRYISSAYPFSSENIFVAVLLILTTFAALSRLRSFSRTAEVFLPILLFIFIFILVVAMFDINTAFLPPFILEQTPQVLSGVPFVAEVLALSVFLGFLEGRIRQKEKRTKTALVFMAIIISIVLLLCVITIGVFGPKLISETSFPFFSMVSSLSFFNIVERIEALILALWVIIDFTLTTTLLFIIINNLRLIFKLNPESCENRKLFDFTDGRWIIWVVVVAEYVLGIFMTRNSDGLSYISNVIAPIGNGIVCFGLLPLVVFVGVARKKV